jgi:hypothetical protein
MEKSMLTLFTDGNFVSRLNRFSEIANSTDLIICLYFGSPEFTFTEIVFIKIALTGGKLQQTGRYWYGKHNIYDTFEISLTKFNA